MSTHEQTDGWMDGRMDGPIGGSEQIQIPYEGECGTSAAPV